MFFFQNSFPSLTLSFPNLADMDSGNFSLPAAGDMSAFISIDRVQRLPRQIAYDRERSRERLLLMNHSQRQMDRGWRACGYGPDGMAGNCSRATGDQSKQHLMYGKISTELPLYLPLFSYKIDYVAWEKLCNTLFQLFGCCDVVEMFKNNFQHIIQNSSLDTAKFLSGEWARISLNRGQHWFR